jgi:hypothetical protein
MARRSPNGKNGWRCGGGLQTAHDGVLPGRWAGVLVGLRGGRRRLRSNLIARNLICPTLTGQYFVYLRKSYLNFPVSLDWAPSRPWQGWRLSDRMHFPYRRSASYRYQRHGISSPSHPYYFSCSFSRQEIPVSADVVINSLSNESVGCS